MAKTRITANRSPTPPPITETLGNIISAFAQELAKASVAADVMRLKMKNIYESNSLLNQYEPSKIRLITAKVTLPVAFNEHTLRNVIDPGLSKSQITSMVSPEVPLTLRSRIVEKIISGLGSQNSFSNARLHQVVRRTVSKLRIDGFEPRKHFGFNKIKDFKNEWSSNLTYDQQARFIYRADDLERLNPENIAKFDITLDISY